MSQRDNRTSRSAGEELVKADHLAEELQALRAQLGEERVGWNKTRDHLEDALDTVRELRIERDKARAERDEAEAKLSQSRAAHEYTKSDLTLMAVERDEALKRLEEAKSIFGDCPQLRKISLAAVSKGADALGPGDPASSTLVKRVVKGVAAWLRAVGALTDKEASDEVAKE